MYMPIANTLSLYGTKNDKLLYTKNSIFYDAGYKLCGSNNSETGINCFIKT